jgi:hypothetical protein
MILIMSGSFFVIGSDSSVGSSLVGLDVGLLLVRACNLIGLVPGSPSLMSIGVFVGGLFL